MLAGPPKVLLRENQLHDLFGAVQLLMPAERTRDRDRTLGGKFILDNRLAPNYGESDEFAAATVDSDIGGAHLPPNTGHGPIESSDPHNVMQHSELCHIS